MPKVPPKAPLPPFKDVNHFSVVFNWKELLDRLKQVFNPSTDGRILCEIQQKPVNKENWSTAYSGYDDNCVASNLDPDTKYSFRMRFRNKHGWGGYSDTLDIQTKKQPLTGEHIHQAIRMENREKLLAVLESGEANIEAQDNLDFTPLMSACQKGLIEFVEILLNRGAEIDFRNKSGKTALMLAAFRGQIEAVDKLIEHGASLTMKDYSGLSALHYASDGEQAKIVKQLLSLGAEVDSKDNMGWSPLIRCAGLRNNGSVQVAYELLAGNAKIDLQDIDGKTCLHNAMMNNHTKLVAYLLDKGANIDLKTNMGYNAVTLAESLDYRAIKELIYEHREKLKSDI